MSGKTLISSSATDFNIYYNYYVGFLNYGNDFIYANRFLSGYSNLTHLISLFELTEIQFAILMNFICLYFTFISTYILMHYKYNVNNFCAVLFMAFFLMKVGSISLLWRQTIACSFILLMLAMDSKLIRLILIGIASSFHVTSLFIAPLVLFIMSVERDKLIKINKVLPVFGVGAFILFPVFYNVIGIGNSFFSVSLEYYYFLDVIKTALFSIIFILFSFGHKGIYKNKDYTIMLFVVIFQFSFFFIPHGFRLIYPLSVCISSLIISVLLVRMPTNMTFLGYHIFFVAGFLRFLNDQYQVQYSLYNTEALYYLFVEAI
ncbi:EpsG family protein [Aliivibrio fischeri]|uniref:EpsG family protein n=1 Tax=Aliivibrio fischeri TaxID=668 RepID=A0A844P0W7_ALIFS|nr:hypothetical protein [Aliivibrio fischeri]